MPSLSLGLLKGSSPCKFLLEAFFNELNREMVPRRAPIQEQPIEEQRIGQPSPCKTELADTLSTPEDKVVLVLEALYLRERQGKLSSP